VQAKAHITDGHSEGAPQGHFSRALSRAFPAAKGGPIHGVVWHSIALALMGFILNVDHDVKSGHLGIKTVGHIVFGGDCFNGVQGITLASTSR
jgi:hypothetical protein